MLPRWLLLLLSFCACFSLAAHAEGDLYLSQEQRTVLSYALESAHKPRAEQADVLARAQHRLEQMRAQGHSVHKVESFEQFLEIWKGPWPDTHSLSLDLEILEKSPPRPVPRFQANSAELQARIDRYSLSQLQQLRHLVPSESFQAFLHQGTLPKAAVLLAAEAPQRLEIVLAEGDRLYSSLVSELDRVGHRIAESDRIANGDVAVRSLLVALFSEYFAGLGMDSKKQIMSSMLGAPMRSDEIRLFEIMIQNSGPQMQKILQIVARQGDLDSSMLEIFRRLESGVRAVPPVLVRELLEKEKRNFKFADFRSKPLGVGTMAQVHPARLADGSERSVVVRFIKPDIEKRVEEDHRVLTKVAAKLDADPSYRASGAPRLSPLIGDITQTVRAELDLRATIERQRQAAQSYQGLARLKTDASKWTVEFSVPEVWQTKRGSALMVQEMVKGEKLDHFLEKVKGDPEGLKKALVEAVGRMWAHQVFFGSGFFHADLHPGNFLIEDVGSNRIRLHMLDYGMAGQLTAAQREQLIALGAGIQLERGDIIAKSFYELSDRRRHKLNFAQIEDLVRQRQSEIRGRAHENTLERWSSFLMDAGLVMPYEFVNVNRGMVIIDKMLQSAGSPKYVASLTAELAARNPITLMKVLRANGFSYAEVLRLGWRGAFGPPTSSPLSSPSLGAAFRCEAVFR